MFHAPIDGPVKRAVHPYADTAGIVRYQVTEGEAICHGKPIADLAIPDDTPLVTPYE